MQNNRSAATSETHSMQACIDRESMATCVELTDSVNERGFLHQITNLQLVHMSGFLENISTYAILLCYFAFPIAINQYSSHNILPV